MELRRILGKKWVLGVSTFFIVLYLLLFFFVLNVIQDDTVKVSLQYMGEENQNKTIGDILKLKDSFKPIKEYKWHFDKSLFFHPEWVILDVNILNSSQDNQNSKEPDFYKIKDLFFCHYPFVRNLEVFDETGRSVETFIQQKSLSTFFLSPISLPVKNGRYFLRYGPGIRLFHSYAFLARGQSLRLISMLLFILVGMLVGLVFSVFAICITFFLMSREKIFLQSAFLFVLLGVNLFIYTDIVGVCFGTRFFEFFERLRLITGYATLTLATFYINSFFEVDIKLPKLYKWISIISLLFLFPLCFFFFTDSVVVYGIFLIFGRIVLFGYFLYILKKCCTSAMGVGYAFFIWGWVFYFLGWGLYYVGLFPSSFFNYFLNSNLWISFFFLCLYNNIALIDRMLFIEMEKSAAEKRLSIERSRIASEIHDSVGADFSVFVQELLANPEKRYSAKKISGRLQLYLERIRDIVYMLNRDSDLACRFEVELISRMHRLERLNKFTLDYKIDPSGENMGLERCYHILRITDEWIANILKHSKPKTIKLRFILMESGWKLVILDDGVGLDWYSGSENNQDINSGQGLASIIWRSNAIKSFARSRKEEIMNRFELVIPGRLI